LPLADANNNIISVTVTGVVTDDTGQPLPGVNIVEMGITTVLLQTFLANTH